MAKKKFDFDRELRLVTKRFGGKLPGELAAGLEGANDESSKTQLIERLKQAADKLELDRSKSNTARQARTKKRDAPANVAVNTPGPAR